MSEHAGNSHFLLHHAMGADFAAIAAVEASPVPITLATRLRLEKLVMLTPVMDLRAITETILQDPGATLQLLRIVGEEFGDDECRPVRVEHCIASLNRERWYLPVCARVVTGRNDAVMKMWQQFSVMARAAQQVAMRLHGFPTEEAYLVGLLYQMGKLPRLLGWSSKAPGSVVEERAIAVQLAELWRLPGCLIEALREQYEGTIGSRWSFLLRAAQSENGETLRADREPVALHTVSRPAMLESHASAMTRE